MNSSATKNSDLNISENSESRAYVGPRNVGRIVNLDILRGIALLGILLANIEDFSGPSALWDIPMGAARPAFSGWHAQLDQIIVVAKWLFTEGKMRGMFALLFGAGSILLINRLEKKDAGMAKAIFFRRNIWLLVFGLVHGFLLWAGDILVDYSILALVFLYPIRNFSARKLMTIGFIVWTVGGSIGVFRGFDVIKSVQTETSAPNTALQSAVSADMGLANSQKAIKQAKSEETIKKVMEAKRGFVETIPGRISSELSFLNFKFKSGWVLEWLGAMITGMGLMKSGFLTNRLSTRQYLHVAITGYALSWPIVLIGLWETWQHGLTTTAQATWLFAPYSIQVAIGTIANIALLLFVINRNWAPSLTSLLANVGRTAFTNYIGTTLICEYVFIWGPWKLFGQLEYYEVLFVTVAIWTANIIFSTIWLKSFSFGPLEWLWRSLTYWKRQPFLLVPTDARRS
jgi:uncharacterized protein